MKISNFSGCDIKKVFLSAASYKNLIFRSFASSKSLIFRSLASWKNLIFRSLASWKNLIFGHWRPQKIVFLGHWRLQKILFIGHWCLQKILFFGKNPITLILSNFACLSLFAPFNFSPFNFRPIIWLRYLLFMPHSKSNISLPLKPNILLPSLSFSLNVYHTF